MHFSPKRINNINIAENGALATLMSSYNAKNVLRPVNLTISSAGGYKVKGGGNVNTIPVINGNTVTANGLLNKIDEVLMP